MGSLNHQRFLSHLDESDDAVWLMARWLQERGNIVTVNPRSRAKCAADWRQHVDMGDLAITQRVEVKGGNTTFTSRHDWPHPEYFVCNKDSFDRAVPRPLAYLMLNRERTHFGLVMCSTRRAWTVSNVVDRRYEGVAQDTYVCPLHLVRFAPLGTPA